MLCTQNASWCTRQTVISAINNDAVPFTTSAGEGDYDLPFGTGMDPITHRRPAPGVWMHVTEPGHRYHPGRVIHVLVEQNKNLWLYTVGVGNGADPAANESQGQWIFANTHNKIKSSILVNGGGQ